MAAGRKCVMLGPMSEGELHEPAAAAPGMRPQTAVRDPELTSMTGQEEGLGRGNGRRLDAAALLLVLAFALALCRPVLLGRVPIASDTLWLWAPWSQLAHGPVRNTTLADSVYVYLSWATFVRQSL